MQKQLLDYGDKIKAELLYAFLNMTFSNMKNDRCELVIEWWAKDWEELKYLLIL